MRTDFETLAVSMDQMVCEIRLNLPEERNAIGQRMHEELIAAFAALRDAPEIRAVLIASTGKVFSAGGSFDAILNERERPDLRASMTAKGRAFFEAIALCEKPLVAALQGDAIGMGATLTLSADAVVAARTARIADPHVVIGLAAGDGGCVLWPQAIGLLRAKRYLLSGDRLSASDAHVMGLVTDLVDTPDEVIDRAREIARHMASLPPMAVQLTKRALNAGLRARAAEVFDEARGYEVDTFLSEDVVEAVAAFRERRPGRYQGR